MVDTALALLIADPTLARYDLSTAAVCGEVDVVAKMIAADPARANMFFTPLGRTPLHYATFSRLGRRDPVRGDGLRKIVRVLLDHGADPNLWFTHDGWVQAPIFGAAGIAGDVEMTRMLLDAGADPNDHGPDATVGEALYHAAELPDPACAQLLIRAGTHPEAVSYCLGRALNFDNPAMIAAFCDGGAQPTAAHLHYAAWRRRGPATVQSLVDAGAPLDVPDEHGLTALQIARRWGDLDVVALLADAGAEPGDDPPLSPATETAVLDLMLIVAVQRGDLADVRRMLDAGARIDGDPAGERGPLSQACWRGRTEIVAELLARGAQREFADGGSALGATRHGSGHCHHPEGGPTMATAEEIDQGPYEAILALLGAEPGSHSARAVAPA
jgi:ankyrin repeat protein